MRKQSPLFLYLISILVFLFIYAPLMVLVVFSVNAAEYGVGWDGFTLKWYKAIIYDSDIQRALGISLAVAVPAVLFSTIIGTITAITLYRSKFRGRQLFMGILYIPLIMPSIVVGLSLLLLFAFIKVQLGILAILLAHISFTVPLTTLVVLGRMQRIDHTLEEAALDLGADEWTTMRFVTIPLLKPGIIAAALLAFPWSFNDFIITYFVSGIGSSTLPIRIYSMIRVGVSPMINALGTLIVLIPLIFVIIATYFETRRV